MPLGIMMFATSMDIPGWVVPVAVIATGVLLTALEVRLSKAGFVKKADLDGLSQRVDRDLALGQREREANARQTLVIRADLDETRDRVTRVEGAFSALNNRVDEQVVKPINRIEEKMDAFILLQAHHDADIKTLKETIDHIQSRRP
jgi:ABC-type thiamine transport system ATPase subunit